MGPSDERDVKTAHPFSLLQVNEDEKSGLDSSLGVLLEPIQPESYDLSYTCLLIPRFPNHRLTGDLADYLPDWLQQTCISYGWRLEFVTADADYFQWGLRVTPSVPPGHFMQTIRSQISDFILSNFGRIRRENLSDDFWAPGYLVVLGAKPLPKEMIEQYIRMTRRQQGLITL